MNKKDEIIQVAADLIHEYGYNSVGISRILEEVNIPKGSFYHYFKSKEDLAINVINYHLDNTKQLLDSVDQNIEGLKKFFDFYFDRFNELEYNRGCAIGNLILELADTKESFRLKLSEWIYLLENGIYDILQNVKLTNSYDKKQLASFIVSSFEGVIMKAKLEKNRQPIDEFEYFIFNTLLNYQEEIE